MVDAAKALRRYLLSQATLVPLVAGRIYAGELPVEDVKDMPRKCITFAQAGGPESPGPLTIHRERFQVICYGESLEEAAAVDLAAAQALKDLDRVMVERCLVHGVALAGGPSAMRTPNEGWPAQVRLVTVTADDREVS